jgi:membrane glycosyltransferase
VWRPDWALALIAVIGMILFFPKALSIALIALRRRESRAYGGMIALTVSVVLEIILSSLLAPIRMTFHSRFVMMNLLGRTVTWRSQDRDETSTSWREALRHHGFDSLVASAWGTCLFLLNPHYFWWVTPIIGALILAVPTSVVTSRVRVGERARRGGLFLIPEETNPPTELRDVIELQRATKQTPEDDGFVRAAVDPFVNAMHRALLGGRRSLRGSIRAARRALLERALADGPSSLSARERRVLLMDPDMTDELHRRVWALPEREQARRWGRPGRSPAP